MTSEPDMLRMIVEAVPELPQPVLGTYARLWQLETWLRQMVYVELRAAFAVNWQEEVAHYSPKPQSADLRLTHMPSPERNPISYITFGALQKTIEDHWALFSDYLPPLSIWKAKLEEVSQIRNRVAHFRTGHDLDPRRVLQFMVDLDQGFWRFCTSYNETLPVLPPSADPVVRKFQHLNQFSPVKMDAKRWVVVGVADPEATYNVAIDILRRSWQKDPVKGRISSRPGYLYNVVIIARDGRIFRYAQLLDDLEPFHQSYVHICLDSSESIVRVTIPAILGTRVINKSIDALIERVPGSLRRRYQSDDQTDKVQRLADEWPEYVLGPKNPLCFLAPDMPCSFFNL